MTDFLRGTLDDRNPLAVLRGNALVLNKIIDEVRDAYYQEHIDRIAVPYVSISNEPFPAPTGLNINMMPIDIRFASSIPVMCQQYLPMIQKCGISWYNLHRPYDSKTRVAYLTVSEDVVNVGTPHRRPGLHIERPGAIRHGGELINSNFRNSVNPDEHYGLFVSLSWGLGQFGYIGNQGIPIDGIYMASNIADSCQIFPELILNPAEVTDQHGGIEKMRHCLGKGRGLAANEIVWFTDRTPHESLKIPSQKDPTITSVYRQFFRLVVGPISVWYSKHNTPNPNGLLPDAPISHDDKFSEAA